MKSQTPSTISQGVRCQESKKTKTCWSEAEIPSEAKRQRGTLKPETSVFGRSNQKS